MQTSILTKVVFLFGFMLIQMSCNKPEQQPPAPKTTEAPAPERNMLLDISPTNMVDFQWLNKPRSYNIENGVLTISAGKETDFFNNPEDKKVAANAPVLFKEIKGDFVARALVRPDFSSLWNAVALMVHSDDNHWIKFAFENSDATGKTIVSVVTRDVSDDANGAILTDQEEIWLKLIRKGNIYSMLWSKDGKNFKMARLTTLPATDSIKVGIEAQSPVGDSALHTIRYFEVVETTVKDLRKGE